MYINYLDADTGGIPLLIQFHTLFTTVGLVSNQMLFGTLVIMFSVLPIFIKVCCMAGLQILFGYDSMAISPILH